MAEVDRAVPTARDDAEETKDYVSFLLAQQQPRPPITWKNWWTEVYWGQGMALTIFMPICTFVAMRYTPLCTNTTIWTIVYTILSGIGECLTLSSSERCSEC